MIPIGTYKLKEELAPLLAISNNQIDRRKEELFAWFENFFEFEVVKKRPVTLKITAVFGDYRALPNKTYDTSFREKLQEQKEKDYEEYTIAALGTVFKPNSKAKIARDAIADFSHIKYSHNNVEDVAKRFVREPFDKHAVTNNNNVWVYCKDYTPLEKDILEEWKVILKEEHISEQEAANAFYRQEQGQDISKEKQYYKNAMMRFKDKYGDTPVLVKEWKVREPVK